MFDFWRSNNNNYCYSFNLQMGFYPVAVFYNKTQHTNNTHHTNNTQHTNNTPHSNKHSTQNYTNNKGHTTYNELQLQLQFNKLILIK
jgi:hypothetical protein